MEKQTDKQTKQKKKQTKAQTGKLTYFSFGHLLLLLLFWLIWTAGFTLAATQPSVKTEIGCVQMETLKGV